MDLTGYARNLPTGAVEIHVEGPAGAVERLLEQARRGPSFSRVDHVQIEDASVEGEFDGFDVRF